MPSSTHSLSIASSAALLVVSVLSAAAVGCAPQQACPPATTATQSSPATAIGHGSLPTVDRHVYRFDFVLAANDGSAPGGGGTTFSLVLQEAEKGEVVVGKNVSLASSPPSSPPAGGPGPSFGSMARQDVGTKVAASFRMTSTGDDVILDVATELSTFEPPTSVRKMVMKGNAIATPGKPALVTTLDDDHKKLQLTVTATKLR
jgi:hypothetical protein